MKIIGNGISGLCGMLMNISDACALLINTWIRYEFNCIQGGLDKMYSNCWKLKIGILSEPIWDPIKLLANTA